MWTYGGIQVQFHAFLNLPSDWVHKFCNNRFLYAINERRNQWGMQKHNKLRTVTRIRVFITNYIKIYLRKAHGLDDRGSRVRFPAGAGNFSLHHRVQNGSEAHPLSYRMGIRGSFPGVKAAGAWSCPLNLHLVSKSKNEWRYTSTPPIHLRGVVQAEEKLYLYPLLRYPKSVLWNWNIFVTK
jgi:hypothetical protein